MQFVKNIIAISCLLLAAGAAIAADWTTTASGSASCTKLNQDGVCWLTNIAADSSAISVRSCATVTVMVYGTGASIMPQACDDRACTNPENLLAAVLTGDSPNTFLGSLIPIEYIRIDWTTDGAGDTNDVSIKCGR